MQSFPTTFLLFAMAPNQVLAKKMLGQVVSKIGQRIAISAATQTSDWKRPDFIAGKVKGPLVKAVLANEEVLPPPGSAEVCSRYVSCGPPSLSQCILIRMSVARPSTKVRLMPGLILPQERMMTLGII